MTLHGYIERFIALPHAWGETDCCVFPAGWCIARGRPDPMARWRGAYSSQAEAMALIESGGGLPAMFAAGCSEAGIPAVEDLKRGDIGVLLTATIDGSAHVGGIFLGGRWCVLGAPRGIIVSSAEHIGAWRP